MNLSFKCVCVCIKGGEVELRCVLMNSPHPCTTFSCSWQQAQHKMKVTCTIISALAFSDQFPCCHQACRVSYIYCPNDWVRRRRLAYPLTTTEL